MKKSFIRVCVAVLAGTAILASANPVFAMHIAEGYLPLFWCIVWYACFAPFLIWGIRSASKATQGNLTLKMVLGMAAAFCFVLSALKIPSVTGSSSHPTGTGLGMALFGPSTMGLLGFIVLVFQALLLAHGGLTTLGANAFSMAVAGPFAGYAVLLLLRKLKCPTWACVFAGAFVADLATYVVTSLELALAFSSGTSPFAANLLKFLTVFAVTQLPLAVVEGIVTVMAYNAIMSLCSEEAAFIGLEKGVGA